MSDSLTVLQSIVLGLSVFAPLAMALVYLTGSARRSAPAVQETGWTVVPVLMLVSLLLATFGWGNHG